MQMLAEEILSPLSVRQDRKIAGLTSISYPSPAALVLLTKDLVGALYVFDEVATGDGNLRHGAHQRNLSLGGYLWRSGLASFLGNEFCSIHECSRDDD